MKEIKLFTIKETSCYGEEPTTTSCCAPETINESTCCSSPEVTVEKPEQKQFNLDLPVAIIGAGPVGLAAAAHLTIQKVPFIVFESGENVGHNILKWQHEIGRASCRETVKHTDDTEGLEINRGSIQTTF